MTHVPEDPEKLKKKKKKKDGENDQTEEAVDFFEDETTPPPPDGGWGWAVVFASFMIHVVTDGVTYSFGVFYIEFLYYFKEGKGETAWIASILVGITLCSGPISSAFVNKYGCRAVTIAGAILSSICLLLSVWAPNVITLYFTIGIGTGLGFGLIYLPAIVCVTIYFEKLRSLATGIAVCGSGIGTLIFAPFIEYLIREFGWRGAIPHSTQNISTTYHFIADNNDNTKYLRKITMSQPVLTKGISHQGNFNHSHHGSEINAKSLGSGMMNKRDIFYQGSVENIRKRSASVGHHEVRPTIRNSVMSLPNATGYKPSETTECAPYMDKSCGILQQMLELSLLKDPVFLIFVISNFCTSIGFNIPYVYIITQAESRSIPRDTASYLLAIIGIANTVGRIVLGYVSDKPWINRLLVYNLCLTICGFATVLSIYCNSFVSFAVYTSVFGFTVGAYVGLTSVILVDLLGLERLTNAFGLVLLFQGIASLLGPPIAGWLYDALGSYDPGFFVGGAMIAISGLILFFIPPMQRCIKNKEEKFVMISVTA
ncbi:Similar to SLC16A14: Monocarboxylate transporter 14 (Homo sapiens) [Cotesia congregata]|uniref:Similar to SLC16A14: Monocarboxylate transporter 14 (Homo sapiens) n=1 Tax=Cotesia congregata TaxID=51543 RepID=A0A8J2MNK1_COTCN|nr:Similar to SLC16A14: Monocarboxylate transporter 14 (Homo sapiens) [Cotesia congregata]